MIKIRDSHIYNSLYYLLYNTIYRTFKNYFKKIQLLNFTQITILLNLFNSLLGTIKFVCRALNSVGVQIFNVFDLSCKHLSINQPYKYIC